MAQFFFYVEAGGEDLDSLDLDLPDVGEAHLEARDSARHMLVDGASQGEDRTAWHMVVTDEAGETVLNLPFSAAFQTH